MNEDTIMLKEESCLADDGTLERPELQSKIDEDPNYLHDSLRIQKLVKEYKNLNEET
jgi:thiaminase